jgi:large subunit ribosomal protein L13
LVLKTYIAKAEEIKAAQKWYLVDASNLVLGRMASRVAAVLKGKHKPIYSLHQDTGDFVVVINAEKVKVTGDKLKNKIYFRYTGYPGGQRATALGDMMQKNPRRVIELAVKRMLPKNALGRRLFRKLKVYPGSVHPHAAQKPEALTLTM